MTIDLNSVIGGGTTLLAVPMTAWLTHLATARAEARAEQETLQRQFDELALAAGELQGVAATNHLLWENWKEEVRTHALIIMATLGGWGSAEGSTLHRLCAGAGELARAAADERRDRKLAAQRVQPYVARIAAAAVPLMRHPDPRIAQASERVLAAAQHSDQPQRLEAALEELGNAVRGFLAPRPSRWARLLRRPPQAA